MLGVVKLKPTRTRDSSQVDVAEALRQQKQESEAFTKMVAVNLENWYSFNVHRITPRYPVLKEHTFPSSWFPLTKPLAALLISEYETYCKSNRGLRKETCALTSNRKDRLFS